MYIFKPIDLKCISWKKCNFISDTFHSKIQILICNDEHVQKFEFSKNELFWSFSAATLDHSFWLRLHAVTPWPKLANWGKNRFKNIHHFDLKIIRQSIRQYYQTSKKYILWPLIRYHYQNFHIYRPKNGKFQKIRQN